MHRFNSLWWFSLHIYFTPWYDAFLYIPNSLYIIRVRFISWTLCINTLHYLLWPQIHVQPVLCILLATFAGLGVAMSGSSIIVEFLRWRRRWRASLEQQSSSQSNHMTRSNNPETVNSDGTGPVDVRTHPRSV